MSIFKVIIIIVTAASLRPFNGVFSGTAWVSRYQKGKTSLGLDLQNILRQSYDYLAIMPKLRSTYDGRLIFTKGARLFLGTIHLQSCEIV